MRIAIVGSGVAGLVAAHVLGRHHDCVLFEADRRLGGHANTVAVDDPQVGPLAIDTGFIVHNDRNYPVISRLFDELGVRTLDTSMSFSVTDRAAGLCYRATNIDTLFADRRNALRPAVWRMLVDVARFYRSGRRFLTGLEPAGSACSKDTTRGPLTTIGDLVADGRYSEAFVRHHLVPLGASVWSVDPEDFLDFPAETVLRFFANHGLLGVGDRPQWRTLVGGSRTYVDEIVQRFPGVVRLGTAVTAVRRRSAAGAPDAPDGVAVEHSGMFEHFDHVVLACHSDQALRLVADASAGEREILGAIRYQANSATLHTDTSLMPPRRRAWAAWNYDRRDSDRATLTYDLTELQHLAGGRRYLLSLNCDDLIDPAAVLDRFDYAHPVLDGGAVLAQRRVAERGAWLGHGFHEDGARAALAVCERLGVRW